MNRKRAIIALVVTTIFSTTMGITIRYLDTFFWNSQQIYLRILIGIVLGFIVFRKKLILKNIFKLSRKELWLLILRSLAFYVFGVYFFVLAYKTGNYALVSFIQAIPITALIGLLIFKERRTFLQFALVFLAFIGVLLIGHTEGNILNISLGKGETYSLISILFFGFFFTTRKFHSDILNNEELSQWMMIFSIIPMILISYFSGEGIPSITNINGVVVVALIFGGVINVFNTWAFNFSFKYLDSVLGGNLLTLESVFGLFVSIVVYQEGVTFWHLLGGGLIVMSTILMNFVGGGSGGHLSIMKAMVDYLEHINFPIKNNLLVVGGKVGMIQDPGPSIDQRRIPKFGAPYMFIRGGKLHRGLLKELSIRQLFTTIRLMFGFFFGLFDAFWVVIKFKPHFVFATGGYVALPVLIMAKLLGSKTIIHEQTLSAGISNKLGSKIADKVLVTFKESLSHFPKDRTVHVGNAIRQEILNIEVADNSHLKLIVDKAKREQRPILYVTGGSLGAHKINLFIEENLEALLKKYSLIRQMGENELYNDFDRIFKERKEVLNTYKNRLYITKYVNTELGFILRGADIVICRPGANTLYELATFHKKAILIPLWVTSKSDQDQNAEWYIQNHQGVVIHELELDLDKLQTSLSSLSVISSDSSEFKYVPVEPIIWKEILSS